MLARKKDGPLAVFCSVIHIVEDPLALLGQTQQVAGQRLDKALVILLGKVGAQGVVLLLLLRQLLFCSLF